MEWKEKLKHNNCYWKLVSSNEAFNLSWVIYHGLDSVVMTWLLSLNIAPVPVLPFSHTLMMARYPSSHSMSKAQLAYSRTVTFSAFIKHTSELIFLQSLYKTRLTLVVLIINTFPSFEFRICAMRGWVNLSTFSALF